jgi:dihydroxyacetone kinase
MTGAIFSPSLVIDASRDLADRSGGTVRISTDPLYLVTTAVAETRRVAIVSGGGSGHEPMHAGFLGAGGLDAVAPGAVFASPHNRQIYEAARAAARADGVLLVVKNYTGDRINFSAAAERLRHDGIAVATVLVDEDVASRNAGIGGRGTAATVLVEKILGAAADAGAGLDELQLLGDRVVAASHSIGVALRAQTVPTTSEPAFALAPGVVEYGVGIHGERGTRQEQVDDLAHLVDQMISDLVSEIDDLDPVVLLVNNLGGLTDLELGAVVTAARSSLAGRVIGIASLVVGTYCSALDMRGFSLTLLRARAEFLPLLFAPHGTEGLPTASPWTEPSAVEVMAAEVMDVEVMDVESIDVEPLTASAEPSIGLDALESTVAAWHPFLTGLDRIAGDGDFGDNLITGIVAAKSIDGPDLERLAVAFLDRVGGTSGPLFGLLFQELAARSEWTSGLDAAVTAIARVGDAAVGDRTMLDALAPAAAAASAGSAPAGIVQAAFEGAVATTRMIASRGRAVYLDERVLGHADAGAVGVVLVLQWLAGTDVPIVADDLSRPG